MPTDFASFNSAMRAVSEVYQQLKFIIAKSYGGFGRTVDFLKFLKNFWSFKERFLSFGEKILRF